MPVVGQHMITAEEREIIIAEMPSYLTKKPECQHSGNKLKDHKLWACGVVQQLAGVKMYVNCAACKSGEIGKQEAARALYRRCITGEKEAKACCGGNGLTLAESLKRLNELNPKAASEAILAAAEQGKLEAKDCIKLAEESGVKLD